MLVWRICLARFGVKTASPFGGFLRLVERNWAWVAMALYIALVTGVPLFWRGTIVNRVFVAVWGMGVGLGAVGAWDVCERAWNVRYRLVAEPGNFVIYIGVSVASAIAAIVAWAAMGAWSCRSRAD
jgi:hypothetical protein